jgi:hypothetical protein
VGDGGSKQFKRKCDADAYVSLVEVDRLHGNLIDPRLGRTTLAEWYDRWWPTVNTLRPSTRARDDQHFRSHAFALLRNHAARHAGSDDLEIVDAEAEFS